MDSHGNFPEEEREALATLLLLVVWLVGVGFSATTKPLSTEFPTPTLPPSEKEITFPPNFVTTPVILLLAFVVPSP